MKKGWHRTGMFDIKTQLKCLLVYNKFIIVINVYACQTVFCQVIYNFIVYNKIISTLTDTVARFFIIKSMN